MVLDVRPCRFHQSNLQNHKLPNPRIHQQGLSSRFNKKQNMKQIQALAITPTFPGLSGFTCDCRAPSPQTGRKHPPRALVSLAPQGLSCCWQVARGFAECSYAQLSLSLFCRDFVESFEKQCAVDRLSDAFLIMRCKTPNNTIQ